MVAVAISNSESSGRGQTGTSILDISQIDINTTSIEGSGNFEDHPKYRSLD